MNQNKLLHAGAVLAAGILWGTMGIFVRRMNTAGMTTMDIVACRAAGTSLVYFLFMALFQRDALKIRMKDLWCFVGTGICSIVFFNYCYYKTILLADLSVAAVLLYTAPSMVIVMSAFLFKEKFTRWRILSLILAFLGCILVTGIAGGKITLTLGAILTGIGSGFGYALYTIFSRFALDRGYTSLTISFYTFVLAILGVSPFVRWPAVWNGLQQVEGGMIFFLEYILITTVFAYFLYTWGMQGIENGVASILATIEPVVATLIGVTVFRESMTMMEWVGVIFVLTSVVLCNRE